MLYICGQNIEIMNYTTVPRSLIYRERRFLKEFGVYEEESITRPLAEAMLRMDFIQFSDSENRALWCMNTAYYICTMILLETDPRWRLSEYKNIAVPKWEFRALDFQILTLSLAGLLLSRLEEPLPLLSWKGQTRNHLVSLMLDDGEFNPIFKTLYERVKASQNIKGTIPNNTFAPRVIDKECIHDVMSDSAFNWVNFTKCWEERSIRDIVKCLGISEDEKHNVIDILRQSSNGFYSAGCNDRPEQVDAMLDGIDQEIYQEYNPEVDQTMEDDGSEQERYQCFEEKETLKVCIPELVEEHKRLVGQLKSIKDRVSELECENEKLKAFKDEQEELIGMTPEERLGIDERAIYFSTSMGLDFDPKRTNQKQLSIMISKLSGDAPGSIRGRISKMHTMEVEKQFSDEILQAARNVIGYLEKVPRGYQTQRVKEMIENIDLVFLNAKNS